MSRLLSSTDTFLETEFQWFSQLKDDDYCGHALAQQTISFKSLMLVVVVVVVCVCVLLIDNEKWGDATRVTLALNDP